MTSLEREVLPARRRRRSARSAHLVLALLACAGLLGVGQLHARANRTDDLQRRIDDLAAEVFELRVDLGWHLRDRDSSCAIGMGGG